MLPRRRLAARVDSEVAVMPCVYSRATNTADILPVFATIQTGGLPAVPIGGVVREAGFDPRKLRSEGA